MALQSTGVNLPAIPTTEKREYPVKTVKIESDEKVIPLDSFCYIH